MIRLPKPVDLTIRAIAANVKAVTELRILTPLEGDTVVEVTAILARHNPDRHTIEETAPLPTVVLKDDVLMAVMADAFQRAKAHEITGVTAAMCLYAGVRDAIYARLETQGCWPAK